MADRRNLGLLLVTVCSVALLPVLMPASDALDPLAPMAPLASPEFPQDTVILDSLRDEASAALHALRTAHRHP